MIGIVAEDQSDAETLRTLVRRTIRNPGAQVLIKGCGGGGALKRKARSHIEQFRTRGATKFIVCHDADGNDPDEIRRIVAEAVFGGGPVPPSHCIVVPTEEIEAWILADGEAISRVIPSLVVPAVQHPEQLASPKEWLEDHSRARNARPLYAHAVHNPRVAEHLRINEVARKCPSFQHLVNFLLN
jgi:hypothetical protein